VAKAADVFISYSREDKDKVLELTDRLRAAGVPLWMDVGGIDGATMWGEEIVHALESAKVLLLMVTESSVRSHNVAKEVVLASERKGHILPVHLERTQIPPSLRYPLAGIQHIEYFHGDADENLRVIIRSLERIGVSIAAPAKAPAPGAGSELRSLKAAEAAPSADQSIEPGALAVLPFDNISPDEETDYFSDGLTEELIARLSLVSEIELISRWASMQYKGVKQDIRAIGHELGARYIVGGSVRRFRDSVRITVQLVDVDTNRQLWGNTYKGKLDDIFDIQEQVAKQIVEALKLQLSFSEKAVADQAADGQCASLRSLPAWPGLPVSPDQAQRRVRDPAVREGDRARPALRRRLRIACSSAYGQMYQYFSREERLPGPRPRK
jgi:adenylate cyclase